MKKYLYMLGLFALISFVPYVLTARAPSYDGQQIMGFPFPFRYYGGLCPDGVCQSFSGIN